ncbi:MAG: hypothetical protein RL062_207 [Bacteroidota bacterium]
MALLSGAALAIAGYWMQLLFRNPLASPSILGVTNGASLGVSVVTMGMGFLGGTLRPDASILAATMGALLILLLLFVVRWRVQSLTGLLIFGVMTGHLAGAVESIFQRYAERSSLSGLIFWSMGTFDHAEYAHILYVSIALVILMTWIYVHSSQLDAWSLGDDTARSLGVSVQRVSGMLMIASGILTAVVTAMAGPIAFIGLASPHLTRLWWHKRSHRSFLIPVCLTGMLIALFCDLMSRSLEIPLNAVTSLVGAPWVMFWILKNRNHVF